MNIVQKLTTNSLDIRAKEMNFPSLFTYFLEIM